MYFLQFTNSSSLPTCFRDEITDLKSEKPEAGEYRTIFDQTHFSNVDLIADSFSDEKKIDIANSIYVPDAIVHPVGSENGLAKDFENSAENDQYQECFSDEIPAQEEPKLEDKDPDSDDVRVGNNSLDEQVHDDVEEDDNCDILNKDVGEQAVALFKQLLHINSSSSQEKGIVHFDPRSSGEGDRQDVVVANGLTAETTPDHETSDGRSVFQPTRIINGKQVCNAI